MAKSKKDKRPSRASRAWTWIKATLPAQIVGAVVKVIASKLYEAGAYLVGKVRGKKDGNP